VTADQQFLTHYGWWLFCPVLLGGLDTEAPLIVPRWFWLAPVYWAAQTVQGVVIGLCSMFHEGYEPMWYFAVTGEIKR
jgi:hypothetical protein